MLNKKEAWNQAEKMKRIIEEHRKDGYKDLKEKPPYTIEYEAASQTVDEAQSAINKPDNYISVTDTEKYKKEKDRLYKIKLGDERLKRIQEIADRITVKRNEIRKIKQERGVDMDNKIAALELEIERLVKESDILFSIR